MDDTLKVSSISCYITNMGNIFNQDFQEFILSLNEAEVDYLLIGGYAVILYGYYRTTGDLDIWINPTKDNYTRMIAAFNKFGLPQDVISIDDFLDKENNEVFTFGRPPVSIDILTKVKGLEFNKAMQNSIVNESEGFPIKLISYKELIKAKKASNRHRDINDIAHLEEE